VKRLRDDLPAWRLALADMPLSKPMKASNGGLLLLRSADEIGDRLAVLLAGDRRGGKTAMINELRDQFAAAPGVIAVMGHSIEVKAGDSARETQARVDAILATGRSQAVRTSITFDVQQDRRPTGKRAQRRARKEWNR
jgi:septum formation topological specificity factor MinE